LRLLTLPRRHARNWRWHKKLHIWLTKDDMMTPQSISPSQEQGYYVVWDTRNWRKERVSVDFLTQNKDILLMLPQREMTLFYEELDTTLSARNGT
jgi:CCR4-NOT transcription complex subunit 2